LIEIDGESGGKLPAAWHVLPGAVQLIVPDWIHEEYQQWQHDSAHPESKRKRRKRRRQQRGKSPRDSNAADSSAASSSGVSQTDMSSGSERQLREPNSLRRFSGVGDGIGGLETGDGGDSRDDDEVWI
jgi:hypothetical protein